MERENVFCAQPASCVTRWRDAVRLGGTRLSVLRLHFVLR